MSPFLVYNITETEVLNSISELGWVKPNDLDGCTSNCSLNAVGNLCHKKKYGFHPYAQELAQLVRLNLLSRDEALQKLNDNGAKENIIETLSKLGLTEKQSLLDIDD